MIYLSPPALSSAPRWLHLARAGMRVSAALLAVGVALSLASLVLSTTRCASLPEPVEARP